MMKKSNSILDKSYEFALRIIQLYIKLKNEKEYELGKQLLRSGTSIGANAEEGACAQSKKDFIAKFSIVLKEAKETHYWIRILRDSEFITTKDSIQLLNDCEEIIRITTSILKTSRIIPTN